MYWTSGPSVRMFEQEIAKYVGCKFGISFNSGTSGQLAMLLASGIGSGDEVIVPSFTFISTCNTVLHTGAKPVFAEIEEISYGLDPIEVEKKIGPNTKAIIPVHYGGGSCRIEELRTIAEENEILLLEDAAESLGTVYNGKSVGTFGYASMYSFCGNKVMTTGEGGMVVTDDPNYAQALRLIRSHGRTDKGDYFASSDSFDYIMLGHNWRMSDITAELGRSQLKKLSFLIEKRIEIASYYNENLSGLPLKIPNHLDQSNHIYQMYTILLQDNLTRERLRKQLDESGVMIKIYFDCVHLTSYYSQKLGTKKGDLPVTEDISNRVLTLPIYPDMTRDEVQYVCDSIEKVVS